MKRFYLGFLLCFSSSCFAGPWTSSHSEGHLIGDIYTYGANDTLSVFLKGRNCENTKNYFWISPDHVSNANQLISMVLAAKMGNKKVLFNYKLDSDGNHCFVKGFRMMD